MIYAPAMKIFAGSWNAFRKSRSCKTHTGVFVIRKETGIWQMVFFCVATLNKGTQAVI